MSCVRHTRSERRTCNNKHCKNDDVSARLSPAFRALWCGCLPPTELEAGCCHPAVLFPLVKVHSRAPALTWPLAIRPEAADAGGAGPRTNSSPVTLRTGLPGGRGWPDIPKRSALVLFMIPHSARGETDVDYALYGELDNNGVPLMT